MLVATLNLLKKGCISGIRTRTRAFPCSRLLQSSLFSSNPNPNPNPASDSQHIHNPLSRFDFGGLEPFNGGGCFSAFRGREAVTESSPRKLPPKDILLDGCDFEHWLVVMEKPDVSMNRDDIIDMYIKTLAQLVGSEEEARMKIYSVSTMHYFAFGALVPDQLSYKLKELPRVRWVLPDSYLDVKNKDYGGEPFINGQAVPYDPKYHEEWVRNYERVLERNRRIPRKKPDRSKFPFEIERRQSMQGGTLGTRASPCSRLLQSSSFSSNPNHNPSPVSDGPAVYAPFPWHCLSKPSLDSDPFADSYHPFSSNLAAAEDPSPPFTLPLQKLGVVINLAVRQLLSLYNTWIHYSSPQNRYVYYTFEAFSLSYSPSTPLHRLLDLSDDDIDHLGYFYERPPHEDYPLRHELFLFWLLTNHALHLLVPCLKQLYPLPNDSDDALLYSELCPFLKTGILGDVSGAPKVAGPDVVSMGRALRSLLKSGRIADAFDFLEEALSIYDDGMHFGGSDDGVCYELKLYHAMLDGLCRLKRTGDAFELCKEMRQASLGPCDYCSRVLVSLLSAQGRYDEASLLSNNRDRDLI